MASNVTPIFFREFDKLYAALNKIVYEAFTKFKIEIVAALIAEFKKSQNTEIERLTAKIAALNTKVRDLELIEVRRVRPKNFKRDEWENLVDGWQPNKDFGKCKHCSKFVVHKRKLTVLKRHLASSRCRASQSAAVLNDAEATIYYFVV